MGVFTDQVQALGSEAKQARRRREQREKEQELFYKLELKLKNKFELYLQEKKIKIGDFIYQNTTRESIYLQLLNYDTRALIIDKIIDTVNGEKINKQKLKNLLNDKYITILNRIKQPYMIIEKAEIKAEKEKEKEAEILRKELEQKHIKQLKAEQQRQAMKKQAWKNLGMGILYTIALIFGILSGIIKGSRQVNTKRRH